MCISIIAPKVIQITKGFFSEALCLYFFDFNLQIHTVIFFG